MSSIEGYVSASSVFPGEDLAFHVRADSPQSDFQIDIHRKGASESLVHSGQGIASYYETPPDASEVGCGWPAAYTLTIPGDWSSGVYIARLTEFLGATTDILFVVKASSPGTNSKILFQLATTTDQAYNAWGGKSLYGDVTIDSSDEEKWAQRARKVSFNRPGDLHNHNNWEDPFITWLENNGFEVEYCTGIDLHSDNTFLNNYQLMLSVGHDEYWSREMRDNVEAFVANGGNLAFFSGNVCWWQVRFEDDDRTMVCYKDNDPPTPGSDPMRDVDDSRVTVNWRDSPVNRPENRMTGVSFVNGAGWWNNLPKPQLGYRVRLSRHWVFDTTELSDGDDFGVENSIIGYETDAALFEENENGIPRVTGEDWTPAAFLVLASADCNDWGPGGQAGSATMGIFRDRGTVFTAATTDWSHGLTGDWNNVSQITKNVLRRLSCPCTPSPQIANSGFEKWSDDNSPEDWVLEGRGVVRAYTGAARSGKYGVVVDATGGQTWISQEFDCEGMNYYRVGCWCWTKPGTSGATIRLQSTTTWNDFAIAEHSGRGGWEYLCAVGNWDDADPLFTARVKIQVADGVIAMFDDVSVDAL